MSVAARRGSRSGATTAKPVWPAPPYARSPSPSVSRTMACAGRSQASSIPASTTCTPASPRAAGTPCGSGTSFGPSAFAAPQSRSDAGSASGARARPRPRSGGGKHHPLKPRPRCRRCPRHPRRSGCRGVSCASRTTATPRPPRWSRGSCGTARRARSSNSADGSAGSPKAAAVRRAQAARQSGRSTHGRVRHAPAARASSRAVPPASPWTGPPCVPAFASRGPALRPRGRSIASSC